MNNLNRWWGWGLIIFALFAFLYQAYMGANTKATFQKTSSSPKEYHLFTVEYTTKMHGKEVEVYRWDPSSLIVRKGESVQLHIHGLHGTSHTFSLPDFQLQGRVQKGQTTTVTFTPQKTGTFPLICHEHRTRAQKGPMIAYITVLN